MLVGRVGWGMLGWKDAWSGESAQGGVDVNVKLRRQAAKLMLAVEL